jgi:cytochrome c peroxidase
MKDELREQRKEVLVRPARVIALSAICIIVTVAFLSLSWRLSAQNSEQETQAGLPATPTPVYNPYPPGILPSNLDSEIARVQREIRGIFNNYLAQWHALPPPTFAGNPPTLLGTGYARVRILGGLLNYDLNMSVDGNQACSFCHMPYAGFSGPIPSVNLLPIAYPGSFHFRFGKRTPQRYTYSPKFPVLNYNTTQGAFFGGNFWDARSTGFKLQSPDAEQAQHPPLDSQEHGLPDLACIAFKISQGGILAAV